MHLSERDFTKDKNPHQNLQNLKTTILHPNVTYLKTVTQPQLNLNLHSVERIIVSEDSVK